MLIVDYSVLFSFYTVILRYNGVSLGLFILAVAFMDQRHTLLSSVAFCLALNYKQMELYHSFPFFFYILGASMRADSVFRGCVQHAIHWLLSQNQLAVVAVCILCHLYKQFFIAVICFQFHSSCIFSFSGNFPPWYRVTSLLIDLTFLLQAAEGGYGGMCCCSNFRFVLDAISAICGRCHGCPGQAVSFLSWIVRSALIPFTSSNSTV